MIPSLSKFFAASTPIAKISVPTWLWLFALWSPSAEAAYHCPAVSASTIILTYNPANTAAATGSYTFTCTRDSVLTDPANMPYTLDSNGGNHNVPANTLPDNVALTTDVSKKIHYSLLTDTGVDWFDPIYDPNGNPGARINGTLLFGGLSLSATASGSFSVRIAPGQIVPRAGDYDDQVRTRLRVGANSKSLNTTTSVSATALFDVKVSTPESCVFSGAPGNIQLAYTSFQQVTSDTSSTFDIGCTKGTAYGIALDATSGTLMNLDYSLKLSAKNATGNGLAQTFTVSASMAAGQSGTCATGTCSANETRSITISY